MRWAPLAGGAPSALGILGPHASATDTTCRQLARPPSLVPVNTQETYTW